jgi:hypothetical protein
VTGAGSDPIDAKPIVATRIHATESMRPNRCDRIDATESMRPESMRPESMRRGGTVMSVEVGNEPAGAGSVARPELSPGVSVRKWVSQLEEVLADGERPGTRPRRRVVVAAVISNPYAGRWSDTLQLLMDAGEDLAVELVGRAQALLDGPIEAYGKAGIAGEHGELEHIAAVLHPKFGAPTRRMTGGVSILPSVKKLGGIGTSVDVPVHHKSAMMVRSHFDAVELRIADAPRADELVIAFAATDGPRTHARVGGLRAEDVEGVDGLR